MLGSLPALACSVTNVKCMACMAMGRSLTSARTIAVTAPNRRTDFPGSTISRTTCGECMAMPNPPRNWNPRPQTRGLPNLRGPRRPEKLRRRRLQRLKRWLSNPKRLARVQSDVPIRRPRLIPEHRFLAVTMYRQEQLIRAKASTRGT